MKERLAELAESRRLEQVWKSKITTINAEIDASPIGQARSQAHESLRQAQNCVAIATGNVQTCALQQYADTGNKTPHPDAKIALTVVLAYKLVEAIGYARDHLPQALKLDKRTFDRAAKVLDLDFVTFTQEPRVRISRDLSAHLDRP